MPRTFTNSWDLLPSFLSLIPLVAIFAERDRISGGKRLTDQRGDEPSPGDKGVFSNPHYCTVSGRHTLAPERDVDFTRRFTMAYEMHDKPIKEWERLVRAREIGRKTEPAEFIQAAKEFVGHGGKYIRTWMIRSDGAAWDSDAEEDMWALPVACEEIERTKAGDKSQPNPR